jgi:tetratricopeptide (TPR) repeat protein
MLPWDLSKRSGNQKSRSTNAASVAARTAIRSVCGTRRKLRALCALLAFVPILLYAADPARSERVDSALSFADGRRADALGLSQLALQAYSRAFDADPTSRQAALAKAACLVDLYRGKEAISILQSLPSSPQDEAERSTLLCLALIQEKQGPAAALAQRDALTALAGWDVDDPVRLARVAEGLLRSGTSLARKSQREIATSVLPAFVRAADLNTGLGGLTLRAAEIALVADDLPTAIRYFREFVDERPEEVSFLEQLAAVLILNHQPSEADELLRRVEIEKPNRRNLYPVMANLYEELNLPARAEIYCVLALHTSTKPVLSESLRLALHQLKQNQVRRTNATLAQASLAHPDSLQLLLVRGLAEKAENRMAEAASSFAQVERLAGGNPKVCDAGFYFEYGAACEQAGQPQRSEAALQRALSINPAHHQSLNYLGYMWAERGKNLKEAKALIDRALELNPNNPAYLDSLAWALFKMGDPGSAEPLMVQALEQVSDDPTLLEHYADILAALGRNTEAVESYRKAMATGGPATLLKDKIRTQDQPIGRK